MGLFTNSKLTALDKAINLLSERLSEFAELPSSRMHDSVAHMFGVLYDEVFKLYYPQQNTLGIQRIRVASKQQGRSVSHVMPVNYWITAVFSMGLALEEEFGTTVFRDQTQRTFAKSISQDWRR